MYGLGSLVKKAVKGVKNVIKSPIGKAAMLGAVGFGIPGTKLGGLFGRAGFGGAAPLPGPLPLPGPVPGPREGVIPDIASVAPKPNS